MQTTELALAYSRDGPGPPFTCHMTTTSVRQAQDLLLSHDGADPVQCAVNPCPVLVAEGTATGLSLQQLLALVPRQSHKCLELARSRRHLPTLHLGCSNE